MRVLEIAPDKQANRLFVKMPDNNYFKCSFWFVHLPFDKEDRHMFNLASMLHEFYQYYLSRNTGNFLLK